MTTYFIISHIIIYNLLCTMSIFVQTKLPTNIEKRKYVKEKKIDYPEKSDTVKDVLLTKKITI